MHSFLLTASAFLPKKSFPILNILRALTVMTGFNISNDFLKGNGNFCLVNTQIIEKPDLPTCLNQDVYYEVIRVQDGKPRFIEEHIQRLQNTLRLANSTVIIPENFHKNISNLIDRNELRNQNIKVLISPDGSFQYAYPIESFYPPQEYYDEGVTVRIISYVRSSPQAKVVNVNLAEMRASALSSGVYELLLMNPTTREVTEGSRSNVFGILNGVVLTPPIGDVLPGITRGRVLKVIEELKLPVREVGLTQHLFDQVSAVFITSTSNGIMPVKRILIDNENGNRDCDTMNFDVKDSLLVALMDAFKSSS